MANSLKDHELLQLAPRPVAALAKHYPSGYAGYLHTHTRAQFLYAAEGSIRLTFDLGRWIVPPRRAVWLPSAYPHQTGSVGNLEMRTLYIQEGRLAAAPRTPRMLRVSPLLHELVMRTAAMPVEYDEDGQDGLLVDALLGEIDWTPIHPVSLPILKDARLQKLERRLMRNPADTSTQDQWAMRIGIAPRTLTRMLQREAAMSFQCWRDHLRTFTAIPLVVEGRPLVEIADLLGFETAWAFTAMFKRVTGKLPSRYNEQGRSAGF